MFETSLDLLGRFKSPSLQEEYILYCLEQRSKVSFATIAVLISVWAIVETTICADKFQQGNGHEIDLVYGVLKLITLCIGLIFCFILTFPSYFPCNNRLYYSYCQVILIFTLNCFFILKAIQHIHTGSTFCIPKEFNSVKLIFQYLSPNISQDDVSTLHRLMQYVDLPEDCTSPNNYTYLANYLSVLVMSFNYQILTAIIYEPRLYLLWGCHLPTIALLVYANSTTFFMIVPLLIGFITVIFLLGELHYQRVQSFLNQKKVRQLLEDNEKSADANLAMEMRHMISNVAHDLKTPLASFTNGLDMIRDILLNAQLKIKPDQVLPPDVFLECLAAIQPCLTNIRNTNAFMLMTINRCLDYTKASKGMKLVPKYETVDLKEALQFPIECMINIQERIGIQLNTLSNDICSHIITDKQWLQENLLCLLSNAVKYSTEGNVTITATLAQIETPKTLPSATDLTSELSKNSTFNLNKIVPTVSDNSLVFTELDSLMNTTSIPSLLFEIEDTGIGISEEVAKNLFNPFKQAQRLAGGTGLGLYSLAKRLEALKGRYGVKPRKDGKQGSLFWFSIPYKPDTVQSAAAKEDSDCFETSLYLKNESAPSSMRLASTKRGGRFEILLVDDAPSILKMSAMMLKRQGHVVWTAENGEVALKKLEEKWKETDRGFDLVLMDLQMPVMDGLEATRRLRKMEVEGRDWMIREEKPCHQVIIGLSANSDHDTTEDAFAAGVDDFFSKPFSITTFNKTIERFVVPVL